MTAAPPDFTLTLRDGSGGGHWVTFRHLDVTAPENPVTFYVGFMTLAAFMHRPRFGSCTGWKAYVDVIRPEKIECQCWQHEAIRPAFLQTVQLYRDSGLPITALFNPYADHKWYRAIECVETGEIWQNAKEASDAIGCTKVQMTYHLTGRQYYGQLRGRHYRYLL